VQDPRAVSVFGLYGQAKTQEFIDQRRIWLRELQEREIEVKESPDKISPTARHGLQWHEIVRQDHDPFIRRDALNAAMQTWRWPLHFIDFETAAPALPFHAGQRPYQDILFQFSHHLVTEDGSVRHASDCLITEGAESPSIEVVRRLLKAIGDDAGTVLHWFPHEPKILRSVRAEIEAHRPADAGTLLASLERLGIEKDSRLRMVDLGALVKEQVFLSGTGGSSSMKKLLRPVMAQSPYLRARYAQPVYGTPDMPSRNFPAGWIWWQPQDGEVRDPYTLLGQLLTDRAMDEVARAEEDDEASEFVANGGAAMLAYAELQQRDLAIEERQRIEEQLKRYCELDTLAMVMVYEALREWVRES
jgi:hypothetical protein